MIDINNLKQGSIVTFTKNTPDVLRGTITHIYNIDNTHKARVQVSQGGVCFNFTIDVENILSIEKPFESVPTALANLKKGNKVLFNHYFYVLSDDMIPKKIPQRIENKGTIQNIEISPTGESRISILPQHSNNTPYFEVTVSFSDIISVLN